MVRNILIEGVDCAGKSTLAKELKNHLGWDIHSLGHKPGNQFERYLMEYAAGREVIFERGHLSEQVYSEVFEREVPFTAAEIELLDRIIRETTLVIFATPPTSLAERRYKERKGVLQPIYASQLGLANRLFQEQATRYPNALIYQSQNLDELSQIILQIQKLIPTAYDPHR